MDPRVAKVLKLICGFAAVYWAGSNLNILEFSGDGPLSPFDALYFSSVTQISLGYGDIIPRNTAAKAVVMLQVASTIETIDSIARA